MFKASLLIFSVVSLLLLSLSSSASFVESSWHDRDVSKVNEFVIHRTTFAYYSNCAYTISQNSTDKVAAYDWIDIETAAAEQSNHFPGGFYRSNRLKNRLKSEPWSLLMAPVDGRRFIAFFPKYDVTLIRWNLYSPDVVSEVPLPAAGYLFTSLLMTLVGIGRYKAVP